MDRFEQHTHALGAIERAQLHGCVLNRYCFKNDFVLLPFTLVDSYDFRRG